MAERPPSLSTFSSIGLPLVALAFIGALVVAGARDVYEAYVASTHWRAVSATVVASYAQRGCGKGQREYFATIHYQYAVDGVMYEGTRIRFGAHPCGRLEEMSANVSRWPTGSSVTAFYDPQQPAVAVLVREVGAFMLFFLPVLLMLIIIIVFYLVAAVRRRRPVSGKLGWG